MPNFDFKGHCDFELDTSNFQQLKRRGTKTGKENTHIFYLEVHIGSSNLKATQPKATIKVK
jgi:hypothetical protein